MMIEALDDKGPLSVDALCKYVALGTRTRWVVCLLPALMHHRGMCPPSRRHVQLRWRRMSCDVKRYRVTDKLKRMMGKQARARA